MKNIIIIGFTALLLQGCNSNTGNSIADNPVTENPVAEVPATEDTVSKTSQAWYMKTVVKATADDNTEYVHNTAGIFGELKESEDGKDRHDIAGFGSAILQVVFPQTEWEANNGDYFSDYHALSAEDSKRVWTFQVKNQRDVDLKDAPLQLLLCGPYDVTSIEENGRVTYEEALSKDTSKKTSITLIDVDNQMAYSYEELKTLQLNMDGLHTRTFRWVIGTAEQADYAPLTTPLAAKSMSLKSTAKTFKMSSETASNSKFGLPPL